MENLNSFLAANDIESIYTLDFHHNPHRWNENLLDINDPIREEKNWSKEIKYMNSAGDDISDDIKKLPKNTGGIYMFYVKGLNLGFAENHIMYIGRCRFTKGQHIRKRATEYFKETQREKIVKLFRLWKNNLYYRYYKDTDNERIVKIEAIIIRAILPPMNEMIPDKIEIQPTVPAFN